MSLNLDDSNEPELKQPKKKRRFLIRRRERSIPLRALVPNVITLMALSAGLTAIRMSIEGRPELAIALILLAAFLDGIDGRVARLLKASSRFGAELDSLADFVNFGVAPAVLLFSWGLNDLKSVGWIAALAFSVSAALRLARFNVADLDGEGAKWKQRYFEGIPAPAGALLVMLPLYLNQLGFTVFREMPQITAIYMVVMACLMVSHLPTFSGKLLGHRIGMHYAMPITVAAALIAAVLLTYPYATLSVICGLYFAILPIGYYFYQRDEKKYEGAVVEEPDEDGAVH